jgi:hypothetical protein
VIVIMGVDGPFPSSLHAINTAIAKAKRIAEASQSHAMRTIVRTDDGSLGVQDGCELRPPGHVKPLEDRS